VELETVIAWLVSGGGAGVAAYFIIGKWLSRLPAETKRYVAFGLSAAIAMIAYTLGAFGGYQEMPVGAQAWIEQLWLVGTSAFGLSQLIHAHELRG
jgi:hypothetical protein